MNPRTATEQKCRDCGEWKPFDHFYRHFRGILCGLCNRMLGQAQDDVMRLQAAIQYLKDAAA